MKKIITIIAVLVVSFTNAQIAKYKASDFNLTSDVTKYEEKEFYFDFELNKYKLSCSKYFIYLNVYSGLYDLLRSIKSEIR